MSSRILFPVLFSFATVSVCMAEFQPPSSEALTCKAPVVNVAKTNRLPREEYASINDTINRANRLFSEGNSEEAEKLCNLAYLKYEFYERQLIVIKSKSKIDDAIDDTTDTLNCNETYSTGPTEKTNKTNPSPIAGEDKMKSPETNASDGDIEPEWEPNTATKGSPSGGTDNAPDTASGLSSQKNNRQTNLKEQDKKAEQVSEIISRQIIGRKTVYLVKKRESLRMVGAKLGANWKLIARDNGLDPTKRLEPGQKLVVDTRRIIPKFVRNGIVINIPDRTLYFFRDNQLAKALPVGLGMKEWHDKSSWQTPTGKFSIVSKAKDPVWHIPPSIQSEMKRKRKTVKTSMPPGNRNPLGQYSLRTSLPGIMIHSTIFPESIYGFKSHGCIRMLPQNMETFFNEIKIKTNGEIIYQPVKLAVSDDGHVFIEVHGDVYSKYKNLEDEVKRLIGLKDAGYKVDWDKIKTSLKVKSGVAEDITLASYTQNIRP